MTFEVLLGTAFLAGWLIISGLIQLPVPFARDLRKRLRLLDLLGFLPEWNFFAPNPGTHDYRLFRREKDANGLTTPWREVVFAVPRPWYGAVWNPDRRIRKALYDLASDLGQTGGAVPLQALQLSVPYLCILRLIAHEGYGDGALAVQFSIIAFHSPASGKSNAVLMRSAFHAIE